MWVNAPYMDSMGTGMIFQVGSPTSCLWRGPHSRVRGSNFTPMCTPPWKLTINVPEIKVLERGTARQSRTKNWNFRGRNKIMDLYISPNWCDELVEYLEPSPPRKQHPWRPAAGTMTFPSSGASEMGSEEWKAYMNKYLKMRKESTLSLQAVTINANDD